MAYNFLTHEIETRCNRDIVLQKGDEKSMVASMRETTFFLR